MPELLVVLGIIGIAVGVVVPSVGRVRDASRQVACLANLHQLSLAFRLYAQENDERFPNPAFSQIPWERSLSAYVPLSTFQCPSDAELAPPTGSSYDWRDTGDPITTLAGKTAREGERAEAVFVFDALPSWHQRGLMNVVRVDGATQPMTYDKVSDDLELPVKISLRLPPVLPVPQIPGVPPLPGQSGHLAGGISRP